MSNAERFAQQVFRYSAVFGLIVLTPMYFLEERIGRDMPPAITHPEHFYGFIGLALVFQLLFLVIASDVRKYRALMPLAVLEKLAFFIPCLVLFLGDRIATPVLLAGLGDLTLGVLFVIAYVRTRDLAG